MSLQDFFNGLVRRRVDRASVPAQVRVELKRTVTVDVTGKGTDDDPIVVPFPTFARLDVNRQQHTALIQLRTDELKLCDGNDSEHQHALFDDAGKSIFTNPDDHEDFPEDGDELAHAQLHHWLDVRYPKHAGEFRPHVRSAAAFVPEPGSPEAEPEPAPAPAPFDEQHDWFSHAEVID